MKKLVVLVTAMFIFSISFVYAEDEVKMPWENLSKGATTTKAKIKDKDKVTVKKIAKNDKEKKKVKVKKKKAAETGK
jgi:uncharacterized protein (UPF0254 family)